MSAKQPIASEVLDLMDRLQRDESHRNVLASSWKLYEAAVADGLIDRGQIDSLARCMQELHSEGLIAYGMRNGGGTSPAPVWDSPEIQQMHDWRVTAEGRRDASLFRAETSSPVAGGSHSVGSDATSGEPADVFISHASEDKPEVARPLADALTDLGWKVWLDELELKIGDSLSRRIDAALARSRFGVVILSPAFFAKEWPQRELGGLAARELATGMKVILPVWHNVDHEFIAYRSPTLADRLGVHTNVGIDKVTREVAEVLGGESPGQNPPPRAAEMSEEPPRQTDDQGDFLFSIPVTDSAQKELIRDKPEWWEFRLYAGVLMQGRIDLEDKWHDHELRLPRGPRRVPSESASEFIGRESTELGRYMDTLERVFDAEILEQAFGPPGQPGDSRRIVHVARGVLQIYESMMDWAAELRSTSIASEYQEILELTARMADGPVRQTRDFIQRSADQIARIPFLVREAKSEGATTESPMEVELVLHVELDPENQEQLHAAIDHRRG